MNYEPKTEFLATLNETESRVKGEDKLHPYTKPFFVGATLVVALNTSISQVNA